MKQKDVELLSNEAIPEAVRSAIADRLLGSADKKIDRELELQRIAADRQKLLWNTPVVAAVAGLLTLSATFFFERLSGQDETTNTITLEEVRQELRASEARLRQELEEDTAETVATLEANAREREFQYEIVKSELTNTEKTNAERAAVLLFLARAGVLTTLNQDALIAMAEEQTANPDAEIIPRLTPRDSARFRPVTPEQLSGPARHMIVAGSGDDLCWSSARIGGGVFTRAFLDGVRGAADVATATVPQDGIVTLTELYEYIRQYVDVASLEVGIEAPHPSVFSLAPSTGEFFFLPGGSGAAEPSEWAQRLASIMGLDQGSLGETQAVVIANSTYNEFNDLAFAKADGERISRFLEEQGFEVFTFYDEAQTTLTEFMVDKLPSIEKENGRVLVYLTGSYEIRPLAGGGSEAFLAFRDSRKGVYSSILSLRELASWVSRLSKTKQVLFVVDSCVGGIPGIVAK